MTQINLWFGILGAQTTQTVPGIPQNLTAVAGNTQVSLSWNVPTNTGGTAITSYTLQRATNSDFTTNLNTTTGLVGTSTVVTGLTNNTTYFFRVAAVNIVGQGDYSSSISSTPIVLPVVSGGVLTSDATYYYRTFTTVGSDSLVISSAPLTFDYLVVAGGGAGGTGDQASPANIGSGGGGAGGYVSSSIVNGIGTYSLTVGAGGTIGTPGTAGSPGGNSSGFSVTASGGGGGSVTAGLPGGSGGGAGGAQPSPWTPITTGTGFGVGISGQGFPGGGRTGPNNVTGAGGGGASVKGTNNTQPVGGSGGNGLTLLGITFGGGGGGGGAVNGAYRPAGPGGTGGGGKGALVTYYAATAGTAPGAGGGGGTAQGRVLSPSQPISSRTPGGQPVPTTTLGSPGASGMIRIRYLRSAVGG